MAFTSHFARVATTQQYGMASFAFRVLSFAAMAVAYFGFTFYQLPGPSNIVSVKFAEQCVVTAIHLRKMFAATLDPH